MQVYVGKKPHVYRVTILKQMADHIKNVIEIIKEVKPGKNKQTSKTINNQPQLSLQPVTHGMIRNAVSYKARLNFQKRSHL